MFKNYNTILLGMARKAFEKGEVPVSAIAVINNIIVAKSYNKVECNQNKTAHAEMLVLQKLRQKLGHSNFATANIAIYVTLEPCAMCMAAISMCKIQKVFYFLEEPKFGGSRIFLNKSAYFKPEIYHIPNLEYEELFKCFFQQLR